MAHKHGPKRKRDTMTENAVIQGRLTALYEKMKKLGAAACLIPTADHHLSEYVAPHFMEREFFSGFTGSAGTLVVLNTQESGAVEAGTGYEAYLWTDGRYFVQADLELKGTGITLMRERDKGVPTIRAFLQERLPEKGTLLFDGRVMSVEGGESLQKALAEKQIRFKTDVDPAEGIWTDRPAMPCEKAWVVSENLTGKPAADKLQDLRKTLRQEGAKAIVLSKLDDLMWLLNLRGGDIECNPVALSYAVVTLEDAHFFIQDAALTEAVRSNLTACGITLHDYQDFFSFLAAPESALGDTVMIDPDHASFEIARVLGARGAKVIHHQDPTTLWKAVKNDTELEHTRETYLRDSAVLTEFLYWLKKTVGKEDMTECSAAAKLDSMRAALPGFIELSFPTISAYGPNAAMMHYDPVPETCSSVEAKGMLLVDSGATYEGGTTDVTRTIVLGEISDEIRKYYTLSVMGMLRLADARFLKGCTGRNLDILARQPLWQEHIDYKCGTGHGIGYMLNVHEGPHAIRWMHRDGEVETALEPGMIVSDEPGVYIEGLCGIRIENILEVLPDVENGDGQFLKFGHLTYVPIDREAILPELMDGKDKVLFNRYHEMVYERIAPRIEDAQIRAWLREATAPIA